MKLSTTFVGALGYVTSLVVASPVPQENVSAIETTSVVEIQSSVAVAGLLGGIIFDVLTSPLKDGLQDLLFPGGTSPVDLSEESLKEISNVVSESLNAAWATRDKTDAKSLAEAAAAYTRTSPIARQDLTDVLLHDLERATELADDANALANHLELYGLQAAPSYQLMAAISVAFKKEIVVLKEELDKIHSTNNAAAARAHLKNQAEKYRDHIAGYLSSFNAVGNSLWRVNDNEKTPPICNLFCNTTYRYVVEHRVTQSSKWTGVVETGSCVVRTVPNNDCVGPRNAANSQRISRLSSWKQSNKAKFLTETYDDNLAQLGLVINS